MGKVAITGKVYPVLCSDFSGYVQHTSVGWTLTVNGRTYHERHLTGNHKAIAVINAAKQGLASPVRLD